jgi:hypothetical protein
MEVLVCTIRTVFIGPVQGVGSNLNYTKFKYFTLREVEEFRLEGISKKQLLRGFAHFTEAAVP